MCRFVAYLGPPITLEMLLVTPRHSLAHQCWAPLHQVSGVVNADGFGVGWYDHARRAQPARYRSTLPMWADQSFASMAGVVAAPAVLAAVRSATPPSPTETSSTPPFGDGPWLFAHNGAVSGFRSGAAARLRRQLSEEKESGIVGASDSEVLFALVLDHLDAGVRPPDALAAVVRLVDEMAGGRLNLVLTDGREIAATRWGDSLWTRSGDGGAVVASEPFGEGEGWEEVPDRSVVSATPGRVERARL